MFLKRLGILFLIILNEFLEVMAVEVRRETGISLDKIDDCLMTSFSSLFTSS